MSSLDNKNEYDLTEAMIESIDYSQVKGGSFFEFYQRVLDILFSIVALTIGLPIILIAAIFIKIEDGGDIFYKQERSGRYGRPFYCVKLRSMRPDAEKFGAQWAEKDDPRVTKVGAFIRKTRIDEIPQIFNILVGDMSLIGPRPERPVFVREFTEKNPNFVDRLAIKPGLTGWAQVNGGYEISPDEKLVYDVYYIRNRSFVLDMKIIFMTIRVVLTGDGAR